MNSHKPIFPLSILVVALSAAFSQAAFADTTTPSAENPQLMETIVVNPSADASAEGLVTPYAGGQVARGGKVGILGNQDIMETPFSTTAYTSELIQDKQAKSVGDVLQNDASVRVARGYGNFQESYVIRGFSLYSDDIAYNGLYSLLPRQYIAAELFERVEVLRGASAFLNGAAPGGSGIGGAINLLPKRAGNEDLNRITTSVSTGGQTSVAADLSRRFGEDKSMGIRLNAAHRSGDTAIANENSTLNVASIGLDWRNDHARLSADIGWQENLLKAPRPNVTLGSSVTIVPAAPDSSSNYAQPWSYSNERDVFGTVRGEYDLSDQLTAWGALGMRQSNESNSLANLTVNSNDGSGTVYRFDNTRKDNILTGEAGIRGKLNTGSIAHEWTVATSFFHQETSNAYAMDYNNTLATNLYSPTTYAQPGFSGSTYYGNQLANPEKTAETNLFSLAIGDTLSAFDDKLKVTLGARQQQIKVANWAYTTHAPQATYDKQRLSPLTGVVFRVTPSTSLYANYVESLAQGPTAPSGTTNVGQMFEPYVSKQKEIGVKWDTGSTGVSLAAYSTTRPRGYTNASNVYAISGENRHKGVELNWWGEPKKGIRILGGLTYTDARQMATGSSSTEGKQVIGVAKHQATIGAEWDVPGVSGLTLDARVTKVGSSYANTSNTLKVPGWTRLDLGARYITEIGGKLTTWRLRLDNATNKSYWASVGGASDAGYLTAGAPRTLTLSASMEF